MLFRRKTTPKIEQPKTAEDYLNTICDNQPGEREEALSALFAMGSEGIDALLANLDKKVYKKPLHAEIFWAIAILAFSAALVFGVVHLFFGLQLTPQLCLIMLCSQMLLWAMNIFSWRQKRNAAAEALASFDDVRAVGMLIKALEFDKGIRLPVRHALLWLLPRMKGSDAGLLNADQRRSLCRTLGKNGEEWNVTVLRALEQVGDASAAPFVLPLTKSKNAAIRQAALDCLPFLQDREAQERMSKNLLLASSAEENPAILLRPASSAPETNPTQLLRPASLNTDNSE